MTEPTYKIIRFYRDNKDIDKQVLVRGLTLEQAQAHCRRDDTKGDGWFDGYEQERIPIPESERVAPHIMEMFAEDAAKTRKEME